MTPHSPEVLLIDGQQVLVIRSAKRKKTVSADRVSGQLRLRVPQRLSQRAITEHARQFAQRLNQQRPDNPDRDSDLHRRASELAQRYFDNPVTPSSVHWSNRQQHRWGSTTSIDGSIRISARMKTMPAWVVDAVLIHELAHLVHPDHGKAFHDLVARYPHTDAADAFLAGVSWAHSNEPPQVQ